MAARDFKLRRAVSARGSWWPGEFGRLKTTSVGGRGRLLVAVREGVNRGVKAAEDAAWREVPVGVSCYHLGDDGLSPGLSPIGAGA